MFKRLLNISKFDIFKRLDELLSENKRNNILDFLDNIRNYKNPQKLRNLLSIGENVNKNILRDYLRRWKDIHDQEVEYEENVIVKQDILTDLLTKREKKNILSIPKMVK